MAGRPPPEALLFSREAIARAVPARAFLEPVRASFAQLAAGEIEIAPVAHFAGLDGTFHVKSAVRRVPPRRAAVKLNGNFPGNPGRHGLPVIQGLIALLDAEDGTLLALLDSIEVTGRRTAAASALAANLLARPDSRAIAFIGCGAQARYHYDAFCAVLPFTRAHLFDARPENANGMAGTLRAQGLVVSVHESARAAALEADVIVTTTPSREPLLRAGDVQPGSFIAAVGADSGGKQELDASLLAAARVVPDLLVQATHMGDLQHAIASGVMTRADVHAELGDVLRGRAPGRTRREEIFVFDSTGLASTDLAAAELVFSTAGADPAIARLRLNA